MVVVAYNSEPFIGSLLDSLTKALEDCPGEVIVVDNGSVDATRELVASHPGVTLVASHNGGFAHGVNVGIAAASKGATGYLILNPDVVVDPEAVTAMAAALRIPGVGIVGPRIEDETGALQPSMRREPTLLRNFGLSFTQHPSLCEYVQDVAAYDTPHHADWLLGAALLVSRPCADAVGPWDESFFLYSEETDFCLRARDAGFRSYYVPDAVVRHVGGGSGQSGTTHAMQILNRVRLYRRRHGLLPSALYYGLTVASELSWLARGATKSKASLTALLRPSRRPAQLNCARSLLPC